MPRPLPEQRIHEQIDAQLIASGRAAPDYKQYGPSAGRGIALRGLLLKFGTYNYPLLVGRAAVDVVEAREVGILLSNLLTLEVLNL